MSLENQKAYLLMEIFFYPCSRQGRSHCLKKRRVMACLLAISRVIGGGGAQMKHEGVAFLGRTWHAPRESPGAACNKDGGVCSESPFFFRDVFSKAGGEREWTAPTFPSWLWKLLCIPGFMLFFVWLHSILVVFCLLLLFINYCNQACPVPCVVFIFLSLWSTSFIRLCCV